MHLVFSAFGECQSQSYVSLFEMSGFCLAFQLEDTRKRFGDTKEHIRAQLIFSDIVVSF